MAFAINFSKDSAASFMDTDENKDTKGFYSVDNNAKLSYEEEKPGVKNSYEI